MDSQILPSALSLIQKGWSIKLFPRPLQRRVILPNEFMSSVPIPDRTRIQLPLAENSTEGSKILTIDPPTRGIKLPYNLL